MCPASSREIRCHLLLVLLSLVAVPAFSAAPYSGQPVRSVLVELRRSGMNLIYNDGLVPDSLLVVREPAAAGGLALLGEILAPHGLVARGIGPGSWVIVAGTAAGETAPKRQGARSVALDEIIVTSSQYKLAQGAPEPGTLLTQADLRSLPKMADEPLRAVHRLPGAASNGLSGLAHMRGGDETETQILLDGMPLREPFHLKSFFSPVSLLDAEIVAELEVYAGGFPVDYGGRMSAVVDIQTIDLPAEGNYGLGASLFHTSALASDTFAGDRGRWVASARRSNLADAIKLANSDLGEPRYLDTFLKAEYDLSDETTLATHLLFANDEIKINDSAETDFAKTTDRNVHLWATAEHRWFDDVTGRALLGWAGVDNDRSGVVDDPGKRTGAVEDHRDSHSALLKLEMEFGDEDLRWRTGIDASWLTATYDYASTFQTTDGYPYPNSAAQSIVRNSTLRPDGTETGAFVAARWRLGNALTGEAGLRWDNQTYDRVGSGAQLSPRLSLLYDLSERTQIRTSWGRFYQQQGINELQVEDGIENFFPAQSAEHLILSVEHAFTDRISARIEAYSKDYEKLKPRFENLFDPLVVLPELETDRVEVAPTVGEATGVEFLIRDHTGLPWGWWLSYAWSDTEEIMDGVTMPRSWDQHHSFNGGISWTRGPWDLALAGNWHSGWPTTPATLNPDSEVIIGVRNSATLEDFHSIDFRAAYTFVLDDSELLAFVEFTNLFGLKNPCCVEYTVREAEDGSAYLDQDFDYWPRFVPNLGVYWKF